MKVELLVYPYWIATKIKNFWKGRGQNKFTFTDLQLGLVNKWIEPMVPILVKQKATSLCS